MKEPNTFKMPEVDDDDIRWACGLLGLPLHAFHGEDGNDPRQEVLKCMESVDVAACPGSGKTTLLVAKLAILANKWPYRTRGVCVLSHTNEARRQVQKRLGNASSGQQLLSYPHFVGTIHSFVNEFVGLPSLRSSGFSVRVVDTDYTRQRRWSALPQWTRLCLERANCGISVLSVKSTNFDLGVVRCGRGILPATGKTYTTMKAVCRRSCTDGYFCYDEVFLWARALMAESPEVIAAIRSRFPLVFIDEAQDNSEDQSAMLHTLFTSGGDSVIRQRFGDANQAIYGFTGDDAAHTDVFPDNNLKKELPNSHRFGQKIAALVDPFALVPHQGHLRGHGPATHIGRTIEPARHTIFLLGGDSECVVIEEYAKLLLQTFSPADLAIENAFWAVGMIHRPDGNGNKPWHVRHYCPAYDPEMCKAESKPQSFPQYILAGLAASQRTGEVHSAVDKVAEGLIATAGLANGGAAASIWRHKHRHILALLEGRSADLERYRDLLGGLTLSTDEFTVEAWNRRWRDPVRAVALSIAGEQRTNAEVEDFLLWPATARPRALAPCARYRPGNVCCYPCTDKPQVKINVGSIHSVKGQNHLATLVLETFYYDHNMESLKEWLSGKKVGGANEGVRIRCRLKTHYVAATRPAQLLCLAMRQTAFENEAGQVDQAAVEVLKSQGWDVARV